MGRAMATPFSKNLARRVHQALDLGGLFWTSDWAWEAVLAEVIATTSAVPNADEWADFVTHMQDVHHEREVDDTDADLDEWEDDAKVARRDAIRFFADRKTTEAA
jgi:hypothetical protein